MTDEELAKAREHFEKVSPLVKQWKVAAITEQASLLDINDNIDGFLWRSSFEYLEGWMFDHIESLDEEARLAFVRIGALLYHMHLEHLSNCEDQIAQREGKGMWQYINEANARGVV